MGLMVQIRDSLVNWNKKPFFMFREGISDLIHQPRSNLRLHYPMLARCFDVV